MILLTWVEKEERIYKTIANMGYNSLLEAKDIEKENFKFNNTTK